MSLRFKRYYKLLVLLALVSAVLILGMGDQRIVAYTVQGSEQVVEQSASTANNLALFDGTVTQSIQIPAKALDAVTP